jgi:hypothetical protein
MRFKLRPNWYSIEEDFDLRQAGIYEWRIAGVGIYVGKALTLRKRINAYPNNVRRMIEGLPWHGSPGRHYRAIHYHLRHAYDGDIPVSVAVLELCNPSERSEREKRWVAQRRKEHLAGGPRVINSN